VKALEALADPTRRTIVELLAEGDLSAGDLAKRFETSRPAVSRHLRVLREQGLVQARVEGRRRVYSLDPEPLDELHEWLTHYRSFWTNRLDALGVELTRRRKEKP
jgi:DNA-binding transcriptional ArsR family regulator